MEISGCSYHQQQYFDRRHGAWAAAVLSRPVVSAGVGGGGGGTSGHGYGPADS